MYLQFTQLLFSQDNIKQDDIVHVQKFKHFKITFEA